MTSPRTSTGSHKTTVSRLCESQGRGSFFLKEIAASQHFLCLKRSAQLTHLTKVICSDLFYHDHYIQNMSMGSGTFFLAFTQPSYHGFVFCATLYDSSKPSSTASASVHPFRPFGAKYHPAGRQDEEAAVPSKCRLSVGPRSRPWAANGRQKRELSPKPAGNQHNARGKWIRPK